VREGERRKRETERESREREKEAAAGSCYGVATSCRLLKIIRLFCRI